MLVSMNRTYAICHSVWVRTMKRVACRRSMTIASLALLGIADIATSGASGDPDTKVLISLGGRLFFDTRLSADGAVSCATCHRPEFAYSDGRARGVGLGRQEGTRNVPSLADVGRYSTFNWDGRVRSLEEQVLMPFTTGIEHGLASQDDLVRLVRDDPAYRLTFRSVAIGDAGEINAAAISRALASFVRSLSAGQSPFDRYRVGQDKNSMSESARRGFEIFVGRGRCASCHVVTDTSASFTDNQFHALGLGLPEVSERLDSVLARLEGMNRAILPDDILGDADIAALGRYVVTQRPEDIGAFRTPSLRNVANTAPYFHDGSVQTLGAAVDVELYYRRQSDGSATVLSRAERDDLLSFLNALTEP